MRQLNVCLLAVILKGRHLFFSSHLASAFMRNQNYILFCNVISEPIYICSKQCHAWSMAETGYRGSIMIT